MFTGLIETVGEVADVLTVAAGFRIRVAANLAGELRDGESVAVNGVCLTATSIAGGAFAADIGPETARVTTLGGIAPGQKVNLERSMRADGRFGGHLVQGHVDGTGTVESVGEEGEAHWVRVRLPEALAPLVIPRGSIALDGVSLTVARLDETVLDVMIIPFTWAHTTLATLHVGDRVNVECDMVGKYVARSVALAAVNGRSI